jgi:pimeloyl-ACP methyl ester carboxylesterase
MGGLIVREYARLFPKDVAGMVLLDPAPDDWDLYTGTETFTYAPESFNIAAASAALRRSDNLGSKPLAVLQAGDDSSVQSSWARGKKDFQGYWSSRQRELSRISTNSLLALAPGVTHDQITEDPPGPSASIMRLVVSAVRSGKPLPSCAQSGLPALGAKCLSEAR